MKKHTNFFIFFGCSYISYTCAAISAPCRNNRSRVVLVIALVTSFVGIGVLVVIICYFLGLLSFTKIIFLWKKQTLTYQSVEAFIRNHGPLGIRRYSYSDIKKMTNTFKYKLGQGGYGGVYKGKLKDGRFVAVKVLKESKGNGEEFLNEVASISRTSHVNIVTLMGFCFEYSKRALIYEFMPNGSLEKFIYKDFSTNVDHQLAWETSYKIAVGIARGLEYLHRGCNTRILHFDIKPHNILLDENFCPKISDFGLAKICSREESIISMVGARGTIGYIAPELFCRNFGGVSHKLDVYSYGMMVLEMIGGRKNIDVSVDRTSEIYFPHWIYKRLELDEELGLQGLIIKEDEESARKMIIVSLWCIQTIPSDRPSMSKVVDMLEGSLDFLQMPPKPFLSSPPRTPVDSSTATILL
ncbi:PR5-like receptor kinase [Quercus lobata]|uniref:PR5-like receptor kinase n=1 Tax=Quercus lobata TaxID=97700 RepID=UPI00124512A0|nr:PR5-like receptor kinase [Quercus lobata]